MFTQSFDMPGPAGRLETVLMTPSAAPAAAALLLHAHPLHGGTMHFKLLFRIAKVLQGKGRAVLRFNFRGVGRSQGVHDQGRGEQDDVRAAIDYLERAFPAVPVVLGGYSFGAVMALRVSDSDSRVGSVLALGSPVASLDRLRRPMPRLFVQGARDVFGDAAAIRSYVDDAPSGARLVLVPEADHYFDGHIDTVESIVSDWL
ncbi:MAG TPA: alpha/beta fold hydrolase [Vicinamibacteria bacterium]|nr:alpha/beta fold hydrolase [Vicinamibacteria bacterium]